MRPNTPLNRCNTPCNLNPKVKPTYVLPTPIWSDPTCRAPQSVFVCVGGYPYPYPYPHTHTHTRTNAHMQSFMHTYKPTNTQTHVEVLGQEGSWACHVCVVCKENTLVVEGVEKTLVRGVELGMRHMVCMYVCIYRYWGRSGAMHATSGA